MKEKLTEAAVLARMVWFRIACYFLIPAGGQFMSETETFSGSTWDGTHPFLKWRLVGKCTLTGLICLVAFYDTAMNKAREKLADRRDELATQVAARMPENG